MADKRPDLMARPIDALLMPAARAASPNVYPMAAPGTVARTSERAGSHRRGRRIAGPARETFATPRGKRAGRLGYHVSLETRISGFSRLTGVYTLWSQEIRQSANSASRWRS